ncbi:MAG: ABC transporter substrate-binding protein [Thermobispora bispora]|jgi:ABC-type Fe3+-hydroxamate transport system substrate-binding protein|nr:cobalamin-binding protein [Actinomycetales bacterium]MBX6166843.1 ABC transporter substrate-binding protein [Thermobispora bispora]QSI46717.1 cobalamin-binding protein [Thermobispora bispora]
MHTQLDRTPSAFWPCEVNVVRHASFKLPLTSASCGSQPASALCPTGIPGQDRPLVSTRPAGGRPGLPCSGYGDRVEYDDLGLPVPVPDTVRRVVSLVPSLTEAVAATDESLLAGATNWCTHPPGLDVPRVRGTKNPDLELIRSLRPDIVLANFEENREPDLAALRESGIPVWTTVIRTVDEALRSLDRMLTVACRLPRPAWLDRAAEAWRAPAPAFAPARRAAIVVWRRPWMVVGRDTFTGDVLARLGVTNVFSGHPERYPKMPLDRIRETEPDLVVLPDEPYRFTEDDGPECFPGIPAALVSGRHLSWYGPSLIEAPGLLTGQLRDAKARSAG